MKLLTSGPGHNAHFRYLRPGGSKGGSSSSGGGEYDPQYDYNALYEEMLNYVDDYNDREIYRVEEVIGIEFLWFLLTLLIFVLMVTTITYKYGKLHD